MKRYLLIIAISLLAGIIQVSCISGSGKKPSDDTAATDTLQQEENAHDYSGLTFASPDEVRAFLDFRKFEDPHGYIAFNGKGGVIDGESFTTTGIELKSDKKAEISISIPKMNLSGKYMLVVSDTGVTLEDEESKNTYKLKDN